MAGITVSKIIGAAVACGLLAGCSALAERTRDLATDAQALGTSTPPPTTQPPPGPGPTPRFVVPESALTAPARHATFSSTQKTALSNAQFFAYMKGAPSAKIVVGYLRPGLAPAGSERATRCGTIEAPPLAILRSTTQRYECMDSWLLDDAVQTVQSTLQKAVCRSDLGACPGSLSVHADGAADPTNGSKNYEIHIGWTTAAMNAIGPRVARIDRQGYVLFSQREADGKTRLYVVGGNTYGTVFGATGLMQDWVGARWLFPGTAGESIPTAPQNTSRMTSLANWELLLRSVDALEEPDYRQRALAGVADGPMHWVARGAEGIADTLEHRKWLLRNRMEPESQLTMVWQSLYPAEFQSPSPLAKGSLTESRFNWAHSVASHIDVEGQAYAHPEWFPSYQWYPAAEHRWEATSVVTDPVTARARPALLTGFTGASIKPFDVPFDSSGVRRYLPGSYADLSGRYPTDGATDLSTWRAGHLSKGSSWKPCFYGLPKSGVPQLRDDLISHIQGNLSRFAALFPFRQGESFAPSDGGGHCQCGACRAVDLPASQWGSPVTSRDAGTMSAADLYGRNRKASLHTRRYIQAANALARTNPSAVVTTYAYTNYMTPPPDEDLVARVAPLPHQGPIDVESNLLVYITQSLDRPEYDIAPTVTNAGPQRRNIERWSGAMRAELLGYYDYPYGYGFLTPRIYTQRTQNALKHGLANHVVAYVGEYFPNFVYDSPHLFALSRLLWNTNTDPSVLTTEWTQATTRGAPATAEPLLQQIVDAEQNGWTRYARPASSRSRAEIAISEDGVILESGAQTWANSSPWQFCPNQSQAKELRSWLSSLAATCASSDTSTGCSRVRAISEFWSIGAELSYTRAAPPASPTAVASALSTRLQTAQARAEASWGPMRVLSPIWAARSDLISATTAAGSCP